MIPGDARSELILSLYKEGKGLSLILNGWGENWERLPSPEKVKFIDPITQVQEGNYKTPTFIYHGEMDEIVPASQSKAFIDELHAKGVQCDLGVIPGAKHTYELFTKPEDPQWTNNVASGFASARSWISD